MSERKIDTEGCQGIKFKNVTPEVFSCMKKKLQNYGMKVPCGTSGMFEGNGIIAHFSWDGEANLVIEIKERSLNTYCGQVSGKFRAFFRECQGL
ncbi:hypothetical protein EQO05_10335 [Methanosarcina sp. MSH10X1]|uniref:hypothetical protein n=1 Tax=Methanosarcina sp. MSH10X1 TaxID=2507075 RepID=UPI000FFC1AD4|nr:hypothetical protein [Methanosarcina sp. MSH10X1]RXA18705.1 hypothetical protein EQO05_10335 [Methanosarcina sp. MSH10X1]